MARGAMSVAGGTVFVGGIGVSAGVNTGARPLYGDTNCASHTGPAGMSGHSTLGIFSA
ncbi:MAG: hypothetical protein ACT4QE_23145 [Anaerolineales bacterium]